jgi:DNA ligase (NAD+)
VDDAAYIKKLATDYYEGRDTVPDAVFDAAVERLRAKDPHHPLLSTPGWGYKPSSKITTQHKIFVGSLPKEHDLSSVKSGDVISPKYDGLAVVAYYERGRLRQVVTRGDGSNGVVVTGKVRVPQRVPENVSVLKGEAVLTRADFEAHLSEYANPRNAAAGIVNSLESGYFHLIRFVAYAIAFESMTAEVIDGDNCPWLEEFSGCQSENTPTRSVNIQYRPKMDMIYLSQWSRTQPCETDGVVVNGKLAIKFATASVETRVVQVHWQKSEKGRLIPVLEVEPVSLYGTTVSRVSAYHAQFIRDNHIGPGAAVKITKSNEIIPYVTEVMSPGELTMPSGMTWDGVHLVDIDPDHIDKSRLLKFVRIFCTHIDGFGDISIQEIMSALGVSGYEDFLDKIHSIEADSSGLAGLLGRLARIMIERFRTVPLDRDRVLFALNLDGVGETTSRDLGPHLEEIIEAGSADGFVEKIKQNRDAVIGSIRADLSILKRTLEVFTVSASVQSTPVILTGSMGMPRKQIVAELKARGFHEEKTPTAGSILIAADPEGTSSKLKKARQVGARIVTEQQFFDEFKVSS